MDPEETFNALLEAFALGMHAEAAEHAENLATWLNRGGFPPKVTIAAAGRPTYAVEGEVARELTRAICRQVLDQHEAGCDPLPEPGAE